MKIYLAHNFVARIELRDTVQILTAAGHEVTSSWITDDSHVEVLNAEQSAVEDLRDIDRADALVLFSDKHADATSTGKGKFLELGYALGKGKQCYVCGQDWDSSVFYLLPQVWRIRSVEEIV